jgi:hypothetical protein
MGILSTVLSGNRHLDFSVDHQPYLVEIFPVWTFGVAVEMSDLWQDSAVRENVGHGTWNSLLKKPGS